MDDYDHTISGLLRKRHELMQEIAMIRERLALVSNDVESIDRVLDAFGYKGDLPDKTTRTPRVVLFYRNELSRFVMEQLRTATEPMTSRDLAERIVAIEGKDKYDRSMMIDIVKRVGKACRQLRARGLVRGWKDEARQHV